MFNKVGIQLVIFLVIRCFSILCTCPNHPSLFVFICRTIFCCPTCFEPLIRVHLQGLIISNHTQFTPTGTIVYIVKHELFTIVHIHWLKQINVKNVFVFVLNSVYARL
jgi:hypothetical protein